MTTYGVTVTAARDVQVTDRRIVATIVDLILLLVVSGIVAAILGGSGQDGMTGFTMLVLALLYYAVFQGRSGQTLSKKLLGIRVIREDTGDVPGLGRGFIRMLVGIVDVQFIFLVGLISIWVSQKNQRIGDMLAHTLVVRDQPRSSGDDNAALGGYGELASIREIVDLTPEEALEEAQAFLTALGYTTVRREGNSLRVVRRSAGNVGNQSPPTLTVAALTQPHGGVRITVRGNDRNGVQEHRTAWTEWSERLPKKRDTRTNESDHQGRDDSPRAEAGSLEGEESTQAASLELQETADVNVYEQIRRLAELRDEGLLASEEFEEKKRELLGRI